MAQKKINETDALDSNDMVDPEKAEIAITSFKEVKTNYSNPQLIGPELIWEDIEESGQGTAFLDWLARKVGMNMHFAQEMADIDDPLHQGEDDLETVCKGLSTHEIGHWHLYPYNLAIKLYLSYQAEKAFKDDAALIYGLFVDYCDNSLVVDGDLNGEDLKSVLRRQGEKSKDNPVFQAMTYAYAQRVALYFDPEFGDYQGESILAVQSALGKENGSLQEAASEIVQMDDKAIDEAVSQYDKEKAKEIRKHIKETQRLLKGQNIPVALPELPRKTIKTAGEEREETDEELEERVNGFISELVAVGEGIRIADPESKTGLQYQYSQLRRFGDAIKPFLDQLDKMPRSGSCCKKGKPGKGKPCKGQPGQGQPGEGEPGSQRGEVQRHVSDGPGQLLTRKLIDGLPVDVKGEVEEGVKQMIKHLPKQTYDEIRKHYLGKDPSENKGGGSGIGTGTADITEADDTTVRYYRDAAKGYGIYVRPKRSRTIGKTKIEFGKKDFKPQDGAMGIDVRFAGGRVLPGLAKVPRHERIPYPANKDVVPNLVIYKDVSGSMPNPKHEKCYSTIAGAIYALSYRRSGAGVGVVLFDSDSAGVVTSLDENILLRELCSYRGGGTAVDMDRLKEDLEKAGKELPRSDITPEEARDNPLFRQYLRKEAKLKMHTAEGMTDFVIITDGGIANIGELIGFFGENPEYRPTIIHTGDFSLELPGYDGKTNGVYGGVTVKKAATKDDIIALAREGVKKAITTPWIM